MKKITALTIVFNIILMCSTAKATTTNMEGLTRTPYPHWHYFDSDMGNQIGRDPFFVSGTPSLSQDPAGPNRGKGRTTRQFSFMDANNKLVVKYDMSSLGDSAYYLLQIANNYSLEFSSNGVDWVFISTNTAPYNNPATQESYWQSKPVTNESPYCFDISSYLPADNFYVRMGDATTGNGRGGKAFNALISKYDYPYFFAGGSEPDRDAMNGDQQWLYQKTGCPDVTSGRFADVGNFFVYKFDLPDGDDTCWIHCSVRGQFIFEIARDSVFSSVDLVISNNPGDLTERTLNIDLKDILNLTSDNLIYVRVRNSAPSGGNGGQLFNLWISPKPIITSTTTFLPVSEEECQILWENHAYNTTAHQRFADGTAHFTYRLDFGDVSCLSMNISGEYLIDVSTNNIDWVNIFNAGAGARAVQNISYNPFIGETLGVGATTNHPVLCSISDDRMTNILYVRISDANPADGSGGNLQNLTVTVLGLSILRATQGSGGGRGEKLLLAATGKVEKVTQDIGGCQQYSFFLLGDLHYDKLKYHDPNWAKTNMPGIWGEFEYYSKITANHTPALFQRLRLQLNKLATPVAGIIQIGDFVEGICGSYKRQCLQHREFIEFVSNYISPPTKFLVTKGNHEVHCGQSANKAYNDVILPWMSKQLGKKIKNASYYYTFNEDIFIFFDSLNPDIDWLESVLSKTSARHKFLITHYPVVPFGANWNLTIFASDSEKAKRQRFQNLLGKYSVIVLCGHWHQYSVLSRKTQNGKFIQMSIYSLITSKNVKATGFISGKERYEANWKAVEKYGSIDTRKQLLETEWPFIDFYEFATMPGYCHIKVYDKKVIVDFSISDNSEVWRSYIFSDKGEVEVLNR